MKNTVVDNFSYYSKAAQPIGKLLYHILEVLQFNTHEVSEATKEQ